MKRNCNLELRLLAPSLSFSFTDHHSIMKNVKDSSSNKTQQLTIFYNGRVASCDATELQARAIISLASGEMEEKSSENLPVYRAASGLSMKRSLQRFLEKRKSRVQSTSPYPTTRQ